MIAFDSRIEPEKQTSLLNWFTRLKQNMPNKVGEIKLNECLYPLGIGMEETLWYIFNQAQNQDDFINYINTQADFNLHVDVSLEPNVFTPEQLEQFNQQGYIVLKKAIDIEEANEACQAIYSFLGASETNENSWYNNHENKKGMMVVFTKHPLFKTIIKNKRIKKAYEQLYGTSVIYPTIDKVSFNAPVTSTKSFMGSPLHWDVSLTLPIPFKLQGLIYLSKVSKTDGAFNCVPGFHHKIGDWINKVPSTCNIRDYATQNLTSSLEAIEGEAGDMVIWHQALPHCATPNLGSKPRLVKYLTYTPFDLVEQEIWI